MNSNRCLLKIGLVISCLLVANGLLQFIADRDLGIGWPHNVLRNWEQLGWKAMGGHLVINPGGHDGLRHPEIYQGHRAASLYPAFLVGRLFSWTGFHAMPFHVLSSFVVLVSIWYLLGGNTLALLVAGLAILSPGFILWPTILDPNTNSVLAGIPYAALLWWRLRQPRLHSGDVAFLLLVSLGFSALNWTTALVHAQIFLALCVIGSVPWRTVALYALAAGVAAIFVVGTGVLSKLSKASAGATPFLQMLAGYTWGSAGYGMGQPAHILLARVGFINVLGLLPVWVLWGWCWVRCARRQPGNALGSLAPLAVAICEVVILRNYFCHHPWMAAPVLLLGAVLSLCVVLAQTVPAAEPAGTRPLNSAWWAIISSLSFGFAMVVMLFYHEHQARMLSLVSLVRTGTERSAVIAVVNGVGSDSDAVQNRWPEMLDRTLLAIDGLPDEDHPVPAAYLLSSKPLETGWPLVSSSGIDRLGSRPLLQNLLKWFTTHVARRKPGDRLDLAEHYYLYRLPARASTAALESSLSRPHSGNPSLRLLSKP